MSLVGSSVGNIGRKTAEDECTASVKCDQHHRKAVVSAFPLDSNVSDAIEQPTMPRQ